MEAAYSNDSKVLARIGDVVMGPGQIRAIVIAIEGTFVTILGVGTNMDTGETAVLPSRWKHKCPASECYFLEKQTLSYSLYFRLAFGLMSE